MFPRLRYHHTEVMTQGVLVHRSIRSSGLGRRLLHSSLLNALAYPHGVDRYVELLRPLALARDVRAEVTAVAAPDDARASLSRFAPMRTGAGFRAGQFVGVSVEVDGVRLTRPYSPAGSEQAPRWRA